MAETKDQKPRGRPRVAQPGSSVTTWLRPGEHDRLIKLAQKEDKSISSLVRHLLVLQLPVDKR